MRLTARQGGRMCRSAPAIGKQVFYRHGTLHARTMAIDAPASGVPCTHAWSGSENLWRRAGGIFPARPLEPPKPVATGLFHGRATQPHQYRGTTLELSGARPDAISDRKSVV